MIDSVAATQDEQEPTISRSWFYFAGVVLYLLDVAWLRVLTSSINERVQYGTAETGWGMLGAMIVLGFPLLLAVIVNAVVVFRTRSHVVRLFVGVALLVSLAIAIGIFGFDSVVLLFGAHADGSPVSGRTLTDPNTY